MLLSKEDTDYSSCKIHVSQKILLKYLETFSRHVQNQVWPMSNVVHPSDSPLPVRLDNDRDKAGKNQSPSAQWVGAPATALKVVLTFSQSPFNLPKKKPEAMWEHPHSCAPKSWQSPIPQHCLLSHSLTWLLAKWYLAGLFSHPGAVMGHYWGRKNLEAPVKETWNRCSCLWNYCVRSFGSCYWNNAFTSFFIFWF